MFIKKQRRSMISWVLIMLLLGTPVRGISTEEKEKVLQRRMEKGELFLPCTPRACFTSIIISYLAICEKKEQYDKRLDILKNAKARYSFFNYFAFQNVPNLKWEDIVKYCQKGKDPKAFFHFIEKQEKIFDNFCYNMYFSINDAPKCLQTIANLLQVDIKIYEPSQFDTTEIFFSQIFYTSSKCSEEPPIQIMRDKCKADLELEYGKTHKEYHYRPILYITSILPNSSSQSNSNEYELQVLASKVNHSASQATVIDDFSCSSLLNSISEKKTKKEEREKKLQLDRFEAIKSKLERILVETEKELWESIRGGDVHQLQMKIFFYKKAENSGLIEILNESSLKLLPSTAELKKKMQDLFDTMKNKLEKIDFSSSSYQKKTMRAKKQYFIDLSKIIRILLFAQKEGYIHDNIASLTEQVLIWNIEELYDKGTRILKSNFIEMEDCNLLDGYLETLDLFGQCLHFPILENIKEEVMEYKRRIMGMLYKKIVKGSVNRID